MIDRTQPLPAVRPCQLLGVARSTAYYQPTPVADSELAMLRRINELHLQYPFVGARMLRDLLRQDSQVIGRRCVPVSCGTWDHRRVSHACTTQRHPAHRIYP
jgi:putative transposase